MMATPPSPRNAIVNQSQLPVFDERVNAAIEESAQAIAVLLTQIANSAAMTATTAQEILQVTRSTRDLVAQLVAGPSRGLSFKLFTRSTTIAANQGTARHAIPFAASLTVGNVQVKTWLRDNGYINASNLVAKPFSILFSAWITPSDATTSAQRPAFGFPGSPDPATRAAAWHRPYVAGSPFSDTVDVDTAASRLSFMLHVSGEFIV